MNCRRHLKLLLFVLLGCAVPSMHGASWFVRPDGGTRYSANVPNGQCDGQADLPYPGSGKNRHCAFKDYRMLFQDGSYNASLSLPSWGWIIAGGDTVIIRGSIGTGVSYRVGWPSKASCHPDSAPDQCWGIAGNAFYAPPPVPSGTATQHTRILGENYQACTAKSARTQIHGGWGTGVVMPLNGSSYVDVACIDITDFSGCGRNDDSVACQKNGQILEDYADDGVSLNNTSTHITLTDMRLHGLSGAGIVGAPGDGFVATDIAIVGNANSGWNADDGSGKTGVGSTLVQNFDISWNGCVEEYPITHDVPYISCRDQSTGGYGDGFGTASVDSPAPGWQLHFDNGVVSYNTQDGLDALHIAGPGSSISETRILAYGNEGEQLKVGGATANIQNSLIVGNCEALTSGTAIPGRPSPTQDNLGNPCRAGNVAVFVTTSPGHTTTYENNTLFSAGEIGLEIEYAYPDQAGSTNLFRYNNNVFVGFRNREKGENPTPLFSTADLKMLTNPGSSWSHNLYYGYRSNWSCPAHGEKGALCTKPGLVDETYHVIGYGNMAPASGRSAAVGAGIPVEGLTTDYSGKPRSATPTLGAIESEFPAGPRSENQIPSDGHPPSHAGSTVRVAGAVAVAVTVGWGVFRLRQVRRSNS